MPGDNFNHVANVSCHPLLKIHVIVECAAYRLFAGASALKFVNAQRFQQTERRPFSMSSASSDSFSSRASCW
jgi:hypothetical protein